MIGFQAREDPFQLLCILEFIANNRCSVRVRLHILLKVELVLQNVVDEPTHEGDIRADANRGIDIGVLRGAREVWINMNNRRSALFRRHHPAKSHRMAFSKVATDDKNAITILQILQEGCGTTAPEACAETRH